MINGKDPNRLINIQDKPTITKPSLAFIILFLDLNKTIKKPIKDINPIGIKNEIVFLIGSL